MKLPQFAYTVLFCAIFFLSLYITCLSTSLCVAYHSLRNKPMCRCAPLHPSILFYPIFFIIKDREKENMPMEGGKTGWGDAGKDGGSGNYRKPGSFYYPGSVFQNSISPFEPGLLSHFVLFTCKLWWKLQKPAAGKEGAKWSLPRMNSVLSVHIYNSVLRHQGFALIHSNIILTLIHTVNPNCLYGICLSTKSNKVSGKTLGLVDMNIVLIPIHTVNYSCLYDCSQLVSSQILVFRPSWV